MRALDDEVRAGRTPYIGISDTPASLISQANMLAEWPEWTAFTGLQVPWSLLQRDIESERPAPAVATAVPAVANLELPTEALERLAVVAPHEPGLPTDFSRAASPWALGAAAL